MHKESCAFTLVEVMIVISIVGVLVAIAIPAFNERRDRSNDASAQVDAKNSITLMGAASK